MSFTITKEIHFRPGRGHRKQVKPEDFPDTRQHRDIVSQPGGRAAPFAVFACSAVLVAVDTYCVRRLLNLPGFDAPAPADLGQEQAERLLEGVSPVLPREEQELAHPAHQARLLLRKR